MKGTTKKGFTLTEILLAVMIVGIIGVALAALTTAATRESGRGRSRMMMRDNLSLLMRQLRQDMHDANQVLYARGAMDSLPADTKEPLLLLAKNTVFDGGKLIDDLPVEYVLYCFRKGNIKTRADGQGLIPVVSAENRKTTDGGTIYRYTLLAKPTITSAGRPQCGSYSDESATMRAPAVKFISSSAAMGGTVYPVPLFSVTPANGEFTTLNAEAGQNLGAQLRVRLIVETPSVPVMNDVVEEVISSRSGFEID